MLGLVHVLRGESAAVVVVVVAAVVDQAGVVMSVLAVARRESSMRPGIRIDVTFIKYMPATSAYKKSTKNE